MSDPVFTEQEVPPRPDPLRGDSVTGPPKRLVDLPPFRFGPEYNPDIRVTTKRQTITIYPATPLWLMSPGLRVYRAKDIIKFEGYLRLVEFSDKSTLEWQDNPAEFVTVPPVYTRGY